VVIEPNSSDKSETDLLLHTGLTEPNSQADKSETDLLYPVLIDPNSQADKSQTDLLHPVLINGKCTLTFRKQVTFFPRVDQRHLDVGQSQTDYLFHRALMAGTCRPRSRCVSADAPATESAVSVARIVLRQNDSVVLRKPSISCQWGGLTCHQP
jgi:hypothetical protein